MKKLARVQLFAAILVAFASGLVFASGFDLTRISWAQSKVVPAPKPTPQEVKPLEETGQAFEAIAEHVTPAVVSITAEQLEVRRSTPRRNLPPGMEDFFRQFDNQDPQPRSGTGSGFIVSKDGYILTNNHVVADADRVTVRLLDNRTFTAKVVGRDPTTDVALIKVDANDLPMVSIGDDRQSRVGQWVVAIGNPLGLDFTVTAGIISARGRSLGALLNTRYAIQDYIQTDAAINPGNSGGPLVNIRGEVIGINSAIASNTGFYAGYGFAIPITLAKQVMDDIVQYGKVRRAVLGINIGDVDPNDAQVAGLKDIDGVKVSGFDPSDDPETSPAKRAGVEVGDVIVGVNGQAIDRVSTLQRVIRNFKPGQSVALDVMRFGDKKTLNVKLGEPPADSTTDVASAGNEGRQPAMRGTERSYDKLGISVQAVPTELASQARLSDQLRRGLLVTDISPTGPAYRELNENSSIIVSVLYPQKREIRSPADFEDVVS